MARLSFGSGDFRTDGLDEVAEARLEEIEEDLGVAGRPGLASERFRRLLRALHRETGERVVVLVDEYDKPILDALREPEVARRNRDFLRGLYSVVKDADAHVRFSFFTGVSRFSKVSVFSGLNNLTDLTLEPPYSSLCGYTEADLDEVFARSSPGWTGSASGSGTTATTGGGRSVCTTRSGFCCCSGSGSSGRTGSRPVPPRSSSKPWPSGAWDPSIWRR